MIQYGSERVTQLQILAFEPRIERRDEQWVDIELGLVLSPATPCPEEITQLTALVICTTNGTIIQIVPLDEGCDCEFQFTIDEKEQIQAYIEQEDVQKAILESAVPK
ncbi:hypothetical protein ACFOLF_01540 [Paenibacillus sepulcri]|uniref:Uncharacterized protein n=1 Tax=Paenibacillus sepulcri TaxID=359917 RepID=A0ABS7C0I0_9BACL|nr:hypothetical protein [Paenibacillus sepulcri]